MIDNPCEWGSATLLIFSENVGDLVYYTHIFPLLISLFLGIFILINAPNRLVNRVLAFMTLVFSIWVYFDLILWASPTPEMVMFFWNAIVPIEMLLYLSGLYLVYLFAHEQKDAPTYLKVLFSLFMLPIVLFAHTPLNVVGLAPDCDLGAFEGILIQYLYLAEIVIIGAALYFLVHGLKKIENIRARRASLLIGSAAVVFLGFFTAGNLTLLFEMGPYYEQYKLFGMPVFAAIVTYAIQRYGAFQAKPLLTEILIASLWILLFSTLLLETMASARQIILLTLLVFTVLGIQLARTVRHEYTQRSELQDLATRLERANLRLQEVDRLKSEFVSIASHQLRSPLTAVRGYASLLLEGSYGPIPQKANEPLERISESARLMANSIEDYLNVSRIESGNMKYHLTDFNLRDQVENICDDLRPTALKHGLVLLFRTDLRSQGVVNADLGKTQQIIHNLLNNAIKYTEKGSITVFVHDRSGNGRIAVEIADTGIGMSEQTIENLFRKFERAQNAHQYNSSGTGLGLYVAFRMAQSMGGSISAHSEGEGRGSRFVLELPLAL